MSDNSVGNETYAWAQDLFPICRSLTGDGVRETLNYIKHKLPDVDFKVYEVPTGMRAFDWVVPKEWRIRKAWIKDEEGNVVVDFKDNNLHVMSYSLPVDKVLSLAELKPHLFHLPEQPTAIPYVTSYYSEKWGFCLSEIEYQKLEAGNYHVYIDSELFDGSLTYGEIILPGDSEQEIFLSTYVCHPSMANNELSGPVVTTALVKWLASLKNRRYTYRIVYVPETIGSIIYLSRNLDHLKSKTVAGFVVTCIGDERNYSWLRSRYGDTLADKVVLNIMKNHYPDHKEYSFLERGSDERQYCSPGVDLPVVSVMRTKYGQYPEYHTSLDNLGDVVTANGLQGGFEALQKCLQSLESNRRYKQKYCGEPQLGKHGLYPTTSTKGAGRSVRGMMNFLAYADGHNDLIDISNRVNASVQELSVYAEKLKQADLIEEVS